MTYPEISSVNMTKGFGEVLTYINTVTENWISNLILIAIYVIVMIGFYKAKDDFQGAFAVAGYSTFVIALLFWVGGFVSGWALGIAVALTIIGTITLLIEHPN
jgi:hypothetical protein